ncbi:hypothetical protein GCM10023219_05990 [Stakelama sediminis]|uniref:histidine kinase n=1 Tax=Stakelama sediminis TaxID=463200 RepID=A0A840YUR1_9SPHN|nr:HAMP domain-containing sensor histidine kinase [Stakelama sediminis]MBB5717316.1 signal transduction histidine kinase [Stakelama sediminis]
MLETALPVSNGRVDSENRLVEADTRLADLNRRAGGEPGAPIAVPQLAATVRLARRLGITISRQIIAADDDLDLDLWVRAAPSGDDILLEVSGWRPTPDWPTADHGARREADFLTADADWTWETDAALCLVSLSAKVGEAHGIDARDLLGQPLTQLFVLAEDGDGSFPILSALASPGHFDGQHARMRATGETVRLAAAPRTDAAGRFAGFIGAAYRANTDDEPGVEQGTVDTAAEEAFPQEFGDRLGRALRMPLNRIIANADSIREEGGEALGEAYGGYAADIASAGRHLLALVDDLADLEAVERDDFAVDSDPLDLADVARQAAGLLSVRADEGQVRIDKPALDESLSATGDYRRCLQILVNLIGNAVRYSPEGAMVWIRLEREGQRACVIVADQGKGIAAEDQARIFEKFERLDPSEPGGSGLGLYIARRLARAMGGDIVVDSAPGQGARFIFTLPAR